MINYINDFILFLTISTYIPFSDINNIKDVQNERAQYYHE
jgi:hypothetical protein